MGKGTLLWESTGTGNGSIQTKQDRITRDHSAEEKRREGESESEYIGVIDRGTDRVSTSSFSVS